MKGSEGIRTFKSNNSPLKNWRLEGHDPFLGGGIPPMFRGLDDPGYVWGLPGGGKLQVAKLCPQHTVDASEIPRPTTWTCIKPCK